MNRKTVERTNPKIEIYMGQKAQQALEALSGPGDWKARLDDAEMHLAFVTTEHFLSSVPKKVQEALILVEEKRNSEDLSERALAVREAIEYLLETWGEDRS